MARLFRAFSFIPRLIMVSLSSMTREEAIPIYRAGEEATVAVLLQLSAAVEDLKKRVEKLEEALARKSTNSSNSSKSPSSDGITKPPGKRRAQDGETKRKPGEQKGHKGVTRDLFPEDQVTSVNPLYPKKCKKCGASFPDTPPVDMLDPEPRRHQQFEIPPKSLIVTEFRRHGCRCSCGTTTWAELPPEAVDGFGPRLTASLAYLISRNLRKFDGKIRPGCVISVCYISPGRPGIWEGHSGIDGVDEGSAS